MAARYDGIYGYDAITAAIDPARGECDARSFGANNDDGGGFRGAGRTGFRSST